MCNGWAIKWWAIKQYIEKLLTWLQPSSTRIRLILLSDLPYETTSVFQYFRETVSEVMRKFSSIDVSEKPSMNLWKKFCRPIYLRNTPGFMRKILSTYLSIKLPLCLCDKFYRFWETISVFTWKILYSNSSAKISINY